MWLTQNRNKQATRWEKCLFPPKENQSGISILRKHTSSCVKFIFRMNALTFLCWLDKILQGKMRFIMWLSTVSFSFLRSFFSLSSHSTSCYHYHFPPASLSGFAFVFLFSFLCLCMHICLYSLRLTLLPICLSFFVSASVHLSWAVNSLSHMGEDQLQGSLRALPQKNWNFYKHIPPIPLNLPRQWIWKLTIPLAQMTI